MVIGIAAADIVATTAAGAVSIGIVAVAAGTTARQVRETSVQVRDFEVHRPLAQQVTTFLLHQRPVGADDVLRLAVLILQSS